MDIKSVSNSDLLAELTKRLNQSESTINEQKKLLKELVDLNSRLEESEKLKSHFLSNIRNEINNPLASILAISQNLLARLARQDEFLFRSIKIIYNEAFNLDFQIKNIMMAADLEAGEVFPEFENINLKTQINAVISHFEDSIKKKNIQAIVQFTEDVYVVSDQYFLNLVLANLVDNAIKFNIPGGRLTVDVENSPDFTAIKIADDGSGIDLQKQDQIFNRFSQLEKGTKKSFGGHGLGLSIVKELLDMLEGKLEIESENKQGSLFKIILPTKARKNFDGHMSYNRDIVLFDQEELF